MKEKNGKFKSIDDFINRVDSKDVNKLQLEGLTKSGAFDEFEKDRNKLFTSIPKLSSRLRILTMTKKIINQVCLKIMIATRLILNICTQNHGVKKKFYQKNLKL